jgi:hypothetical protein
VLVVAGPVVAGPVVAAGAVVAAGVERAVAPGPVGEAGDWVEVEEPQAASAITPTRASETRRTGTDRRDIS